MEGADEITVKPNDDRELKGRIVGTDPNTDLALLKIEGDDFPTIPVGDSDQLKVGEWVLAVGCLLYTSELQDDFRGFRRTAETVDNLAFHQIIESETAEMCIRDRRKYFEKKIKTN